MKQVQAKLGQTEMWLREERRGRTLRGERPVQHQSQNISYVLTL